MSEFNFAIENQLLSTLYVSTYQRLLPHLELVSLTAGQIVHQPYKTVREVYFPQSATFSLVLETPNSSSSKQGLTAEVALVGNEGMVGLAAILGGESTTTSSVVQASGTSLNLQQIF